MKHKTMGQVHTPQWIVNEILDYVGYSGTEILSKKIMEPSCGDGAFLKEIVSRILRESELLGKETIEIKEILESNVFGIELDPEEYEKCIKKLNEIVKKKIGIEGINWKIELGNTLYIYRKYLNEFDFVVGNPPYIRVHNLDNKTRNVLKREFKFSEGTIDIYLAFFELGFKIMNSSGILGYITPNSYLHNTSYRSFRKYLKTKRAVKKLVDFKSNKVFKNFSTYTAITIIDFHTDRECFDYMELIEEKIKKVNCIYYHELEDNNWSFTTRENMDFMNNLYKNASNRISDFFEVQYGFATLRDKIFIGNIEDTQNNFVLFNGFWIEKEILHPVVKGSTYKGRKGDVEYIIFPYKKYNNKYAPLSESELKRDFPNTYKYLLHHKDDLLKRDIRKDTKWYEFGRSQGLQTIQNEKIVISTMMKDRIYYYFLDDETFVYSGIFITKKDEKYDWKILEDILKSEDFRKYVLITGKNFSGGYKGITSKQIKNYPVKTVDIQRKIYEYVEVD